MFRSRRCVDSPGGLVKGLEEEQMKFALLYFYDPAQAGPAEGEVSDWLALEMRRSRKRAPTCRGPVSMRRAPLGR